VVFHQRERIRNGENPRSARDVFGFVRSVQFGRTTVVRNVQLRPSAVKTNELISKKRNRLFDAFVRQRIVPVNFLPYFRSGFSEVT